jgi:ketosteroid isomerase-like protein
MRFLDRSAVGLAVIEGREAIRSFFEEWTGAYDEYEVELEKFRDLGNGVFFQALLQQGRPRGTGESVQLRFAFVVTTEDGLVVDRQASYTDIDEGRAAAERLAEERR